MWLTLLSAIAVEVFATLALRASDGLRKKAWIAPIVIGYLTSFAFIALAVLKPIFPANVGVQYVHGFPIGLGAHFPLTPGTELGGGYWLIPFALLSGLGIFIGTHRGARKFLSWWREQRLS